jgi:SRSO17 transposase
MAGMKSRSAWNADAVRDAYQQFMVEVFGDPEAILVLDETGFLKKGERSVGVQRQYSGTAGKVENCQLGVFLAYVTSAGPVLLDRRLYLPASWAHDPARPAAAKVPEAITFQTMPQLALTMLSQAWAQDVPHGWVTADERYGGDPQFLAALEARGTVCDGRARDHAGVAGRHARRGGVRPSAGAAGHHIEAGGGCHRRGELGARGMAVAGGGTRQQGAAGV